MRILDGKAVVITGAGRGLGRAYAEHAARAGAAVVVNDVDGDVAEEVAEGIRSAGGRAVASVHDVSNWDQASAVIDRCVREFGTVDGLVANAGVRYQSMLWEEDPARMRALIEINVLGSMYCASAAAKVMRANGGGSIVTMSSLAMLGQPTAATYSTSKGAVASMTFAWAVELAEHGIRANAVCPLAYTRLTETDTRARTPRDATPDRVAPVVTYLLSDRAAAVTGQLIRFTGDKLFIVRQVVAKEPTLVRDRWEVEDIAKAFDDDLECETPPAQRWSF